MPLGSIIQMVAAHTGIDPVAQRPYLLTIINRGAKNIYDKLDTVHCLREQIFTLDTTIQLFALPNYVGELRAARIFNIGLNVEIHDMSPRYAQAGWREQYNNKCLVWRNKGVFPVKRFGENSGVLLFQPTGVETSPYTITVTGGNPQSQRINETITIPVGSITPVSTVNSFTPEKIESIRKSAFTQFDVKMLDLDGIELARIANSELFTEYTLIQISDYPYAYNNNFQYVECIYKLRLRMFNNDNDQFPGGDRYDEAIYLAAIINWAMKKEGKSETVQMAASKCTSLLSDIASNADAGIDKQMDFGTNQYLQLLPRRWWSYQRIYR